MNHNLILCWLVAAIAGCSSTSATNHSISASEFQRSCSTDSDCVPIYEGTLGCCGSCPNAAVNQVGYSAYQAAVSSRTPTCDPPPPCAAVTDVFCRAGAICTNGTCAFTTLGTDASSSD